MKKRIGRSLLAALAFFGFVGLAYTLAIVAPARNFTKATIVPALAFDSIPLADGTTCRIELTHGDLSQEQLSILLAVEDPAFFEHNGIDLTTPGAGLTTITQGLVKHLYFEEFKPGFAKLKQSLIAVYALDALVEKNEQVTLALNTDYFGQWQGQAVYGFSQASLFFYAKPFSQLTTHEFTSLVAMLVAPNRFHVVRNPDANARRVARIGKVLDGSYQPSGLRDVYYVGA